MDAVQRMRREWGASDAKRDEGLTAPCGVERCDNIPYGDDALWQSLDVYRPRKAGVLPVIVSVHGGGWVYGTKETYQYYCMSLCRGVNGGADTGEGEGERAGGFAVVNFNYRLAPEHPFPASLEDTARVFEWVEENAARYGMDKDNIFAVGDSAGAHILALYAATYKNKLRAVALNCGAYHGFVGELSGAICPNAGKKKMNVLSKIQGTFPPAFCMTSTGDFLKEETVSLFRSLVKALVPCECRLYGSEDNLLPHVFHADMKRSEAAQCNEDEMRWFNRWIT